MRFLQHAPGVPEKVVSGDEGRGRLPSFKSDASPRIIAEKLHESRFPRSRLAKDAKEPFIAFEPLCKRRCVGIENPVKGVVGDLWDEILPVVYLRELQTGKKSFAFPRSWDPPNTSQDLLLTTQETSEVVGHGLCLQSK